jgi:hypothetical protein
MYVQLCCEYGDVYRRIRQGDLASRRAVRKPILRCETVNTERFGEVRSRIVTNGVNALVDLAAPPQVEHSG